MEHQKIVDEKKQEKIREYEATLWQRAEEFSIIRQALQQRVDELDVLFHEKPLQALNLYEQEVRGREERRYQEIKDEIEKIESEEKKIEKALTDLGSGILNENEIRPLIPVQDEEDKKLSKRRKRILEEEEKERKRLGDDKKEEDPVDFMYRIYGGFWTGASIIPVAPGAPTNLATGRHKRKVTFNGGVDPLYAAERFFFETADTHGGKVAFGKKHGPTYVGQGGRRVRKK